MQSVGNQHTVLKSITNASAVQMNVSGGLTRTTAERVNRAMTMGKCMMMIIRRSEEGE